MEQMDGQVHLNLHSHLGLHIFQHLLRLPMQLAVAVGDLCAGSGGGGDAASHGCVGVSLVV
jgi:hypothetical protein